MPYMKALYEDLREPSFEGSWWSLHSLFLRLIRSSQQTVTSYSLSGCSSVIWEFLPPHAYWGLVTEKSSGCSPPQPPKHPTHTDLGLDFAHCQNSGRRQAVRVEVEGWQWENGGQWRRAGGGRVKSLCLGGSLCRRPEHDGWAKGLTSVENSSSIPCAPSQTHSVELWNILGHSFSKEWFKSLRSAHIFFF